MTTYRELAYFIIDQIKTISDDSIITIDHIVYLLNQYRNYFIEQKIKTEGVHKLSSSSKQTICLDLEVTSLLPDNECEGSVLRSVQKVPNLVTNTTATAFPINYFMNVNMCIVSKERYRFVGYNKYMKNIIYVTIGDDNKVYLKSNNPQFQYLRNIKISGIFEDSQEAGKLACDNEGNKCDILDTEFPLDSDLIPSIIDTVTKILTTAAWRQQDSTNDSRDDLADLMTYLSKNTKSQLAKQLSE